MFSGYTGDDCSLDQCTCSERGKCHRTDTSHWCHCDDGYTGDECQYRLCTRTSCYNSGNCTNGDMEHYSCSCPEWATGTQCESLVNIVLPGFTVPNTTGMYDSIQCATHSTHAYCWHLCSRSLRDCRHIQGSPQLYQGIASCYASVFCHYVLFFNLVCQ